MKNWKKRDGGKRVPQRREKKFPLHLEIKMRKKEEMTSWNNEQEIVPLLDWESWRQTTNIQWKKTDNKKEKGPNLKKDCNDQDLKPKVNTISVCRLRACVFL